MTKDEALRQALEALTGPGYYDTYQQRQAIAAIKQALEQPEPEPVAWIDLQKQAQQIVESKFVWKRFIDGTPLANDIACWMADFAQQHTSPPKREPLTDDEIAALMMKTWGSSSIAPRHAPAFARAIEAAHGIGEKK